MEKTTGKQYVKRKDNLNNFYYYFNEFLQTKNPDNLELELVESDLLIKLIDKSSKQPKFTLHFLSNGSPQKMHIKVSEKAQKHLQKTANDNSHILFSYRDLSSVDTKDLVFLVKNVDSIKRVRSVLKSGPNINISQAKIEAARNALANGNKMYPQDIDSERYIITNFTNLVYVLNYLQAYNNHLASISKLSYDTTISENSFVMSKKSSQKYSKNTNSQEIQSGLEELAELVRLKKYLKPFKTYCKNLKLSTNEHPITVDFKKNKDDKFSLIINSSSPQAVLNKEKLRYFLIKKVPTSIHIELLNTIEFINYLKLPQDSSSLFNFRECGLSSKKENSLRDLKIFGCDLLDVSAVADMSGMFSGLKYVNPDVSNWDVSNVTNMSGMFSEAWEADPDVSNWDVSNVTNMSDMFYWAKQANPNVSKWNVSNVTDMSRMFNWARQVNPDVSNWDVSNVTNMSAMFNWAGQVNPDVSNWDVSNVTNMSDMFGFIGATPDVSGWNVANVTDMSGMFEGSKADPEVSNWDVSNVTDMSSMFAGAGEANPDVSNWGVSNVTNMYGMFEKAFNANPDVSNWDVSNVTDMSSMFEDARNAEPDVSNWDVSNVKDMFGMFSFLVEVPDVSNWDVSNVTNMSAMFYLIGETPDVSKWNVANVTDMSSMFEGSLANPEVSNWDVSNVTNMSAMFADTEEANPDVSNWNVSNVTDMSFMFADTKEANPDVSNWNLSNVTDMSFMFADTNEVDPDISY